MCGRKRKCDYTLYAVNGTPISTYGFVTIDLDLRLRHSFKWNFVIADVDKPIIGFDFLAFYNLFVDVLERRLIDKTTLLSSIGKNVITEVQSIKTVIIESEYSRLLSEYPDIT